LITLTLMHCNMYKRIRGWNVREGETREMDKSRMKRNMGNAIVVVLFGGKRESTDYKRGGGGLHADAPYAGYYNSGFFFPFFSLLKKGGMERPLLVVFREYFLPLIPPPPPHPPSIRSKATDFVAVTIPNRGTLPLLVGPSRSFPSCRHAAGILL
jgi:hypothetical protein